MRQLNVPKRMLNDAANCSSKESSSGSSMHVLESEAIAPEGQIVHGRALQSR